MEKRFLTVSDVAIYLGMSEDTIRKWALRGKIPFSKFGNSMRFDMRKIETWIKQKECYDINKKLN